MMKTTAKANFNSFSLYRQAHNRRCTCLYRKSKKLTNQTITPYLILILVLVTLSLSRQIYANELETYTPYASDIHHILSASSHPYFSEPYTDKEHDALSKLYQLNQNQLLWFSARHPVLLINQLLELYADAPQNSLISADYASDYLKTRWQTIQQSNPDFHEFAVFDTALSLTFLRYLNDLHYGRVNPENIGFSLQRKNAIDLVNHLYSAIKTGSIIELADRMEPKLPPYQQLKKALAKYKRLQHYFIKQPVHFSFRQALRPGDWSTEVSKLQHYLNILNTGLDQAIPTKNTGTNSYTGDIVKKIRKLQTEHNLSSDGIIGKDTLAILNMPIKQRIEQIELSMERLRWLPEQTTGPFILVNIPAFQLWAYDTSETQSDGLNMNVIVGKARTKNNDKAQQTPVFTEKLSFLVFSPYWNIPNSILTKEILPLLAQKPDYLQRNHMEIVANFSNDAIALPINAENITSLKNGHLKLRQRPGKHNALGHIKFIFPNAYKVYLHDTPTLSLFKRPQRDFSHGCIRVENPSALAQFVLQNQPEWDDIKIRKAMTANVPLTVNVKRNIPVLIFYITALATKTGVSFYPDIYNHDHTLKSALAERSQNLTQVRPLPGTNASGINMHKIRSGVIANTTTR